MASDGLRFEGSQAENPISMELRVIRQILIKEARGSDYPWLEKWWLYMTEPRDKIKDIHW